MSIKKMLLLASMALAAIAFAAPAVAQANVTLTKPNGTKVKNGAKVTVTSTNLRTTVGQNTLECEKVTLHYVVKNEGPEHVVLDPVPNSETDTHNGTAVGCATVTPFGTFTTHIPTAGTGTVTIDTWGTATVPSTFTSEATTPFGTQHCTYEGNVKLEADEPGADTGTVGPSALTPSEGCEEGMIHGNITVETPNGSPVLIDYVKTG